MYSLPYFKESDPSVIINFMRSHPFAFISGVDDHQRPVATQIPVFIDEKDGKLFISGHMMRKTDHHLAFEKNPNVLAVFTGPHSYVSATWYDDPHQASTWNYMSVHAKGLISFGDDEALIEMLKRLTLHYENGDTSSSTIFDNLPESYRDQLMKGIVVFEIEIHSIDNVFKLSQNRDEKSYENIIEKLSRGGTDGSLLAEEMKKRKSQLFSK